MPRKRRDWRGRWGQWAVGLYHYSKFWGTWSQVTAVSESFSQEDGYKFEVTERDLTPVNWQTVAAEDDEAWEPCRLGRQRKHSTALDPGDKLVAELPDYVRAAVERHRVRV